ncbi:Alpha/beta hydrolase fold-1 [Acididesulfobacillus acetoxydans]|uniref:Alpha/beta hydrolase fold-1 n=2 Tax=Acididesulfobacillus acetoxydans TaxID=1561005 RepID=A0A8S0VWB0_9FIRM|nr:Alpha/beta hydrolase fold-1 [Acididesulfobacillus acetoxydans]CEJ09444.1 Hydrolase, alpha/beta domain protein [Acididesulfobacillus acetoxydans]
MSFAEVSGERIHYEEAGKGAAGQPTVLFVHGAGGSSGTWKKQLAGLRGRHLVAVDLPGHGESGGEPQDEIAGYREFVRCFAQVLGLKRFVLAGHSMGGGIALDLALTYPETLAGIILVGSGARLKVSPAILEVLAEGKHPLGSVKYMYARNADEKILDEARKEMEQVSAQVFESDFQACNRFDVRERVASVGVPALILCGEDDLMTPVKFSRYLRDKMLSTTLILVPAAGHMVMSEQPQAVNRSIEDFLATL